MSRVGFTKSPVYVDGGVRGFFQGVVLRSMSNMLVSIYGQRKHVYYSNSSSLQNQIHDTILGQVPHVLKSENNACCTVQVTPYTDGMTEKDRHDNIIATHEKDCTCGYCFNFGDITFPICNCFPLPYLETKRSDGTSVGKTLYICDACCFVPKFDVFDESGHRKYRIKPDTCVLGMCVMCRCGEEKGKCCRIPFIVRDPNNLEPIAASANSENKAMVDSLWTGWANECCRRKNAYHLVFPSDMSVDDKLLLTGSGILIDLLMFEQKQDD